MTAPPHPLPDSPSFPLRDFSRRNLSRQDLSRRDFLKLAGLGLLGTFIPPLEGFLETGPESLGRVIYERVPVFDTPSLEGKQVREAWKDMLLPITGITLGDGKPAHNRVWYQMDHKNYVHSGGIQPVQIQQNEPLKKIPAHGVLAEVTVPYTDARRGPAQNFPVAYRYYYETTHWVISYVQDKDQGWYQILEDKWDHEYYVPAAHLRIIPHEELSPLSPEVPLAEKRIEVRTDLQAVAAFEWGKPVFMTRASTGGTFSNGRFATPPGQFLTFRKRPSRHMAAGNLAFNGYDLPGVPWITYFTESGISFHGTYWHNDYGLPRSHGCINLTPSAAKWIYRWTLPVVPPSEEEVYEDFGTLVTVTA